MTSVGVRVPGSTLCASEAASTSKIALVPGACLSEAFERLPESSPTAEKQAPKEESLIAASTTLTTDPPSPSPGLCTGSTDAGSGSRTAKRVDFRTRSAPTDVTDSEVSIRSLPPSRECRSSKSILKPGRVSLPGQEDPSGHTEDSVTMLDTILQQLARPDGQIKFDAYATLVSALKTYAELPDGRITKEKIQSLLGFIRADLNRQITEPMEPPDTNLMLQALKLLVTIVWTKSLSIHLTDPYRCFIIDHSTRILEEHKMPKAVILHYLHLLSTQEFTSKVMTNPRAIRLLEVLKDISDHVKGNGVISERLMVYHRISEQAKGVLKSRPSCWVAQLLSATTSPVTDIRKKATNLGHRMATVLGPSTVVANYLHDLMEGTGDQELILSSTICKKLIKMTKSTDEARQVPQVWAVVMLLMGGLKHRFGGWQRLHDWLRIIQKCFNCSDAEVRTEANKAWNKFVHVACSYDGKKSFLMKMLIKPIIVQLDRPGDERQLKSTRKSAFAAYCNLLYYALKPSASFNHYDVVWDEYIVSALRPPFLSNEQNSDRACRILAGLFWKEKISPWRENRALDAAVVEPEELPLLDCKWIRSRTRSILELFDLLFRSSCWGLASYPATAYIAVAWRNFAKALGDACRKEVRASADTINAVTHIVRFLSQMCHDGPAALNAANECYVYRFHFICKAMISEVGPICFGEENLSNAFDSSSPVCSSKSGSRGRPPVLDLLEAMQIMPAADQDGPYFDMVVDLLRVSSKARSSVKGRVQFYRQCAGVVCLDGSSTAQRRSTWRAISKLSCAELGRGVIIPSGDAADVEDTLASVVKILEHGIPYHSVRCEAWSALLKHSLSVTDGSDQLRMVVLERLTTCLNNHNSDEGSMCTATLVRELVDIIQSAAYCGNRRATSKRTKRQYGEVMLVFRRVVGILDLHMARVYSLADWCDEAVFQPVIDATILLLQSCPSEHILACLTEMQDSLALWLEDGQRLMTSSSRAGSWKLSQARKLCPAVIGVLGKSHAEIDLKLLDKVFAAAFRSSHKFIINLTVEMWNSTYGMNKDLEYGEMLKEAFARLIPFIDLELRDLDHFRSREGSPPALHYIEDSESGEEGRGSIGPPEIAKNKLASVLPAVDDGTHVQLPGPTGGAKVGTLIKVDGEARLRHDDSQVLFVSIESSPLLGEDAESQDLTARQKEVRERQKHDAALLFPDLRSSPILSSNALDAGSEVSSLFLGGDRRDLIDDANPATPALSTRQRMSYEEAAEFSPTPKSKQPSLRFDDIEIPSSPTSTADVANAEHMNPAAGHGGSQGDVQAPPLAPNAVELGLAEDMAGESLAVTHVAEDGCSGEQKASSRPLRDEEQCYDQINDGQTFSNNWEDSLADNAEVYLTSQAETEDNPLLGRAFMHVRTADITATNEAAISDYPERTSKQRREIAESLPSVVGPLATLAMTVTRSQSEGSNKKYREPILETPVKVRTSEEEHINLYSDDNDFWSASQLSQDLERAASSDPSPPPGSQPASSPSPSAKRKRSPGSRQRSKRRRMTGKLVPPQETLRLPCRMSEVPLPQSTHGCMEVESTCPSQQQGIRAVSRAVLASVVSPPLQRRRGRPRKTHAPQLRPSNAVGVGKSSSDCEEDESHERAAMIEVCIPTDGNHGPHLSQLSNGCGQASSHYQDNADEVPHSSTTSNREPAAGKSEMQVKAPEKESQVPAEEAMELLQKALSSLKHTSMGRTQLRAIDDLVFEIRTEAQNAAQRSGAELGA